MENCLTTRRRDLLAVLNSIATLKAVGHGTQSKDIIMLYTVVVVLLVLWLLGFIGHIGGGLIHLLLVIAVVILIFNLISGRRGL
jgi:hypothetical protein